MNRFELLCGVGLWVGTTLLLGRVRGFHDGHLLERLAPYVASGHRMSQRRDPLSTRSIAAALAPVAVTWGSRLSRALGIREPLDRTLERIGSPDDVSTFRMRQGAWAVVGLTIGALCGAASSLGPLPIALGAGIGAALAFLVVEQQLLVASRRWQQRLRNELAIVSEQFGILLSSGYSLVGAINRLAERGRGLSANELHAVGVRIRQGVPEDVALREFAERSGLVGLERLVSVLALNREAADLGPLISAEARALRRDLHRDLLEVIERRSQQVWIPVTVATLLPGVIFMAVPFIDAMGQLTG